MRRGCVRFVCPTVAAVLTVTSLGFVSPAAADSPSTVGPEVTVEASTARMDSGRTGTSIAFDGTNYLVVWSDRRNDPQSRDIYGARVTPDGSVLDPNGIAIAVSSAHAEAPAVAFDGTNFFVVWQEYRQQDSVSAVVGARVAPDGTVIAGSRVSVLEGPPPQPYVSFYDPSISFNSEGTGLVAWTRLDPSGYTIEAARVTSAGAVLDHVPLELTPNNSQAFNEAPSVTSDGTDFIVVYFLPGASGLSAVRGVGVGSDGILSTPREYVLGSGLNSQGLGFCGSSTPTASYDGTNYLIAAASEFADSCGDEATKTDGDITGLRVGRDLAPLGSSFVIANGPADQQNPKAVWNGRYHVVAYRRSDASTKGIRATIVDRGGSIVGAPGFVVTAQGSDAAIAMAAGPDRRSGVVYERLPEGATSILFRSITSPK